ncbi:uncharacterized protein PF3D7_1120000-like [Centruroides vittatus]|uniref:uncharacterized protein PF3D7_1120000-like n=1 Tax=Centruroides vittatus TaxID=120091 RepID=UPI0035103A5E
MILARIIKLTDHKFIEAIIKLEENEKFKKNIKITKEILESDDFIKGVKRIIDELKEEITEDKWERSKKEIKAITERQWNRIRKNIFSKRKKLQRELTRAIISKKGHEEISKLETEIAKEMESKCIENYTRYKMKRLGSGREIETSVYERRTKKREQIKIYEIEKDNKNMKDKKEIKNKFYNYYKTLMSKVPYDESGWERITRCITPIKSKNESIIDK